MVRFLKLHIRTYINLVFFFILISLFLLSKSNLAEASGAYCMNTYIPNVECGEFDAGTDILGTSNPCKDAMYNSDCTRNYNPFATTKYTGDECVPQEWPGWYCEGCGGGPLLPWQALYCRSTTPTPTPAPSCGFIAEKQQCNSTGTAWVPVQTNVCTIATSCNPPKTEPVCNVTPTPISPTPTPILTCVPDGGQCTSVSMACSSLGAYSASGYGSPYCSSSTPQCCIPNKCGLESGGQCTSVSTACSSLGAYSADAGKYGPPYCKNSTPQCCVLTSHVTVQGRNVDINGNVLTTDIGQQIIITGPISNASSSIGSWNFTAIPTGTYTVSAAIPTGYTVSYSYPGKNTNNLNANYTASSSLSVILPNNNDWADIYFKYAPVCVVKTQPALANLAILGTGTITASVISGLGSGTILQMRFGAYNTTIATVSPTSDSSSTYSTIVTGRAVGSTEVWGTADVDDNGDSIVDRTCQSTSQATNPTDYTDTVINVSAAPTPTRTCTLGNLYNGNYYSCNDGTNYPSQCYSTGYISYFDCNSNSICVPNPIFCPSGTICQAVNSHTECVVSASAPGWIQTKGADIRWDNGAFSNSALPSGKYTSDVGLGGMPGIIFSGGKNGSSPCFGSNCLGQSSTANWTVGKSPNPDVFTDTHSLIPTSYRFLSETADSSGITPEAITSASFASGITPNSINHGIYQTDNNGLTINTPIAFGGGNFGSGNFVILVKGDLNINANITVPVGSTVVFSASENIMVDKSVTEIDGLYSTDKNFTINGSICPTADSQLKVYGTAVANAGRLIGKTFTNNRTLCGLNSTTPSVIFTERPDFMLNYPSMVKQTTRTWQESPPSN